MCISVQEDLDKVVEEYFYERAETPIEDQVLKVTSVCLGGTHMIMLVRRHLAPFITNIQIDFIPLGHLNIMTNKGGVKISFNLGNHKMLLINNHLAATDDAVF